MTLVAQRADLGFKLFKIDFLVIAITVNMLESGNVLAILVEEQHQLVKLIRVHCLYLLFLDRTHILDHCHHFSQHIILQHKIILGIYTGQLFSDMFNSNLFHPFGVNFAEQGVGQVRIVGVKG